MRHDEEMREDRGEKKRQRKTFSSCGQLPTNKVNSLLIKVGWWTVVHRQVKRPANWVKILLIKVGGRKDLNVLERLADRMKS